MRLVRDFTFAQQAMIVYNYLCSNVQENRYAERQILSHAVPTADESNHSAAGMLHPHCSATCVLYDTLLCPVLQIKEICPFPNC